VLDDINQNGISMTRIKPLARLPNIKPWENAEQQQRTNISYRLRLKIKYQHSSNVI